MSGVTKRVLNTYLPTFHFFCVSAISTHQSELDAGLMAQLAELQALAEHMWPSLKPSQGPSPRESGDYLSTTSLDAAAKRIAVPAAADPSAKGAY